MAKIYTFGGIRLNASTKELTYGGRTNNLTKWESQALVFLMQSETAVNRHEIAVALGCSRTTVNIAIRSLRAKLGAKPGEAIVAFPDGKLMLALPRPEESVAHRLGWESDEDYDAYLDRRAQRRIDKEQDVLRVGHVKLNTITDVVSGGYRLNGEITTGVLAILMRRVGVVPWQDLALAWPPDKSPTWRDVVKVMYKLRMIIGDECFTSGFTEGGERGFAMIR